jgi:hypothetical protein
VVLVAEVALEVPALEIQQVEMVQQVKVIKAVMVILLVTKAVEEVAVAPEQLAVTDHHTVVLVAPDYLVL